ncbi:hypothetical protein [Aureitalea marina]|uniref:Uncharacterized protein n=1 Tax=Aureitalea marina TaxID=930804 RepID=A0A2S7KTT4_9FLAO|nr:hypothetical protein [Aureitalea marina]PQB06020.1 hypothetical protein BST85_08405 [Aureitalea marina]
MLFNVSYNNPAVRKQIDSEIGKPYTLAERLRLKGIGSPRLVISEASIQIHNLLILDNNRNYANIELRPGGILVGFRSLLESYALVIPFHKLTVYKTDANVYTIHRDNYFVRIELRNRDKSIHRFMQKLTQLKTEAMGDRIEDL